MFCCLQHNVETFCRKQDSPMCGALLSISRGKQMLQLSAITSFRHWHVDDTRWSSSHRRQSRTLVTVGILP